MIAAMRRRPSSPTTVIAAAVLAAVVASPSAPQPPAEESLARAEALLEGGGPGAALEALEPAFASRPPSPRALLLASSARFMLGDVERGRRELDRALELDPGLRQGWLNLAALELSEGDYDAAAGALERARDLDPRADDNDLNLGAVRLLQGRAEEAAALFQSYFEDNPGSGLAVYLVASNYALAGHAEAAISLLERAISLDERVRLRARTDPNFADLESRSDFQRLLGTDGYAPPPGARTARQSFEPTYAAGQGRLLPAVLDALQESRLPFDPRIEVTPGWALIWAEGLRVRVANADDGRGEVVFTAPPDSASDAEWAALTGDLYRRITIQLVRRREPDRR